MTTPTDRSSGNSGSLSKATAHTCGLFVKSHDAIGVFMKILALIPAEWVVAVFLKAYGKDLGKANDRSRV